LTDITKLYVDDGPVENLPVIAGNIAINEVTFGNL
jgi:hypothetical protein